MLTHMQAVQSSAQPAQAQGSAQVLCEAFKLKVADAQDLLAIAACQGRPDSVEAAAGIFFDERIHLLRLLVYLLQIFLGDQPVEDAAVVQHITQLLRSLVGSGAGRVSLLARLCQIAQVRMRPQALHHGRMLPRCNARHLLKRTMQHLSSGPSPDMLHAHAPGRVVIHPAQPCNNLNVCAGQQLGRAGASDSRD